MTKNNLSCDTMPKFSFAPDKVTRLLVGKYLVIDPCYVFGNPDVLWSDICNAFYPPEDKHGHGYESVTMKVETESGTHTVVMFGTAYGDGEYPVFDNDEYIGSSAVDAGLLSFVPAELIEEIDASDHLGTWVQLVEDAKVNIEGGDATCGNIFVDTCGCSSEGEDESGM